MKISTRLAVAIVSNLVEIVALVLLLVYLLPHFGIHPPPWVIVLAPVFWLAFSITLYRIGSVVLRRKAMPGFTDMTGLKGTTSTVLDPVGMVSIEGELWKAESPVRLPRGRQVIVTSQEGMFLKVRPVK